MTILVCGEALFDLFQAGGDALSFDVRAGGSPFNVAVGIARLGGDAALLTGISDDFLGEQLFALLRREGVDTRFVVRSARPTTLSLVGLDATGAPAYRFYGERTADTSITVGDLPALSPEINGLHFASYAIAVTPVADALAALAACHRDRFISLDPNVRPTIEPDLNVWRARIDAMRAYADLVKVSAEDLGLLYPETPPGDVAARWVLEGCPLVIVTDGAREVRIHRAGGSIAVTPPSVAVVDTVGAGDAFHGALLAGLQALGLPKTGAQTLADADLVPIVERASRAGAVVCGRRGSDMPHPDDLA